MSTEAKFVSVRTASQILDDWPEAAIYAAIAAGKLPAARIGEPPLKDKADRRRIRIRKADLDAWFETQMSQPESKQAQA